MSAPTYYQPLRSRPFASHQNRSDDKEPDNAWQSKLVKAVEGSSKSMIDGTAREYQKRLKNAEDDNERGITEVEYRRKLNDLGKKRKEDFPYPLDRERQPPTKAPKASKRTGRGENPPRIKTSNLELPRNRSRNYSSGSNSSVSSVSDWVDLSPNSLILPRTPTKTSRDTTPTSARRQGFDKHADIQNRGRDTQKIDRPQSHQPQPHKPPPNTQFLMVPSVSARQRTPTPPRIYPPPPVLYLQTSPSTPISPPLVPRKRTPSAMSSGSPRRTPVEDSEEDELLRKLRLEGKRARKELHSYGEWSEEKKRQAVYINLSESEDVEDHSSTQPKRKRTLLVVQKEGKSEGNTEATTCQHQIASNGVQVTKKIDLMAQMKMLPPLPTDEAGVDLQEETRTRMRASNEMRRDTQDEENKMVLFVGMNKGEQDSDVEDLVDPPSFSSACTSTPVIHNIVPSMILSTPLAGHSALAMEFSTRNAEPATPTIPSVPPPTPNVPPDLTMESFEYVQNVVLPTPPLSPIPPSPITESSNQDPVLPIAPPAPQQSPFGFQIPEEDFEATRVFDGHPSRAMNMPNVHDQQRQVLSQLGLLDTEKYEATGKHHEKEEYSVNQHEAAEAQRIQEASAELVVDEQEDGFEVEQQVAEDSRRLGEILDEPKVDKRKEEFEFNQQEAQHLQARLQVEESGFDQLEREKRADQQEEDFQLDRSVTEVQHSQEGLEESSLNRHMKLEATQLEEEVEVDQPVANDIRQLQEKAARSLEGSFQDEALPTWLQGEHPKQARIYAQHSPAPGSPPPLALVVQKEGRSEGNTEATTRQHTIAGNRGQEVTKKIDLMAQMKMLPPLPTNDEEDVHLQEETRTMVRASNEMGRDTQDEENKMALFVGLKKGGQDSDVGECHLVDPPSFSSVCTSTPMIQNTVPSMILSTPLAGHSAPAMEFLTTNAEPTTPTILTVPPPTPSALPMESSEYVHRKTSPTADNNVDLKDPTDAWGTHWYHRSPYDIDLANEPISIDFHGAAYSRGRRASMSSQENDILLTPPLSSIPPSPTTESSDQDPVLPIAPPAPQQSPFGFQIPEEDFEATRVLDGHPSLAMNIPNIHDQQQQVPSQLRLLEMEKYEAMGKQHQKEEYSVNQHKAAEAQRIQEASAELVVDEQEDGFEVKQQAAEDPRRVGEILDEPKVDKRKEEFEFNQQEAQRLQAKLQVEESGFGQHKKEKPEASQQEEDFQLNRPVTEFEATQLEEEGEVDQPVANNIRQLQEKAARSLEGSFQDEVLPTWLQGEHPAQLAQDPADETGARDRIINWLKALFCDKGRYRELLSLEQICSQTLVNLLQELLDSFDEPESKFRKDVIVILQRFATKAEVYPTSYQVKEKVILEQEHYRGSGGFGEIYNCHVGGRTVCAKVIKMSNVSKGKAFMKQFLKEAILWAQLSHQNIVPFQGFFYYSNRPCLISPWMSNGHINDYLENNPTSNRYLLIKDMTEGLHYLHSWGIVHGDLKGGNVMVDDSGRARLTDFGISSVFDSALPHWTSQSTVASKGGSIRWQAPELLDGNDDQDAYNTIMSDVYAWGCTCYETFTGKLPFYEVQRDYTVMFRVTADGLRPSRPSVDDPAWLHSGLQQSFWDLMESCWAKDPAERPPVNELLSTPLLVEALDNRPVDAQLESSVYRTTRCGETTLPTIEELERLLSRDPSVSHMEQ